MSHLSIALEDSNALVLSTNHAAPPAVRRPFAIHAWHLILLVTVVIALVTASECSSVTHLDSLRYGFVLSGWWGAIAFGVWRVGQRWPQTLRMNAAPLLLHLAAAAILGVGHLYFMAVASFVFLPHTAEARSAFIWTYYLGLNRWGLEMLVYGFIFGIAAVANLQLQAQKTALQSLELQRALSTAQLHALQAQVEPHFLFNTLNSITELVEVGQRQQAGQMLKHLNAILKSTLGQSAPQKIPLAQELDFVENYLAIEQVRFADRLQIEFRIDPSALNALVPSFLLQPLVENAIRHGIGRSEEGGLIQTFVERNDDTLYLRVLDSGTEQNEDRPAGHGIGLSNTASRLAHFYPKQHTFQADKADHGGFQVRIAIPYEQ